LPKAVPQLHSGAATDPGTELPPRPPDAANSTRPPPRSRARSQPRHTRSPAPLAGRPCRHRVPLPRLQPGRSSGSSGQRSLGGSQDKPPCSTRTAFGGTLELPARLAGLGDSHAVRGQGRRSPDAGRRLGEAQDPARGRAQVSDPSWENPEGSSARGRPSAGVLQAQIRPRMPPRRGLAADPWMFHAGIIHCNSAKNPRHRNAPLAPTPQNSGQKARWAFAFPSLCSEGWACFASSYFSVKASLFGLCAQKAFASQLS